MTNLHAEFVMCDIETLGTPRECGTTFIAMPNAAFVAWQGFDQLPHIYYVEFNIQKQLDAGAKVNARTIAFWMNEALRQNPAADLISKILEMENDSNTEFFAPFDLSEEFWETNPGITIFDALVAMLRQYGNIPHYGNGPDFDQAIYSAVVANISPHTPEIWGFNQTSSARTLKELYRDAGEDFNGLQNESYEYAERIMRETEFLGDHAATKHDPVFDALAEAFVVASIKQYFLK